jgi:hypothetical protein
MDSRVLDFYASPGRFTDVRDHGFTAAEVAAVVRLTVALLRAAGVPARARCGFGAYFRPGWLEDHWIAGNLRLDFASLNKVEMLPWDVWGAGWEPGGAPTGEHLELFDAMAALTVDPDHRFDVLRATYEKSHALRMDGTVFNVLRGVTETV